MDQLVYECMFPKPKSTDPQNFQGLLQRNLVPEVRLETQAFYGHLSSQEAKYPGLNYSYKPHRVRLSRYPWHRRLFRAFDSLQLTGSEIANLTKWEGTLWAKERFEKEQGIVIRDTTSDGIDDWVPPEMRVIPMAAQAQRASVEDMEDVDEDGEMEENENAEDMEEDEDEDSDVEITSVGIDLNERLRAAAAEREAGNAAAVMDEEWEQWLKDAVEAGGIPFSSSDLSPSANIPGTRPATDNTTMQPRYLNAARLGQWQQIPEHLHASVRHNLEATNRRLENTSATASPAASSSASSSTANSPYASTSPRTRPISTGSSSTMARLVQAQPQSSAARSSLTASTQATNYSSNPFARLPPSFSSLRDGGVSTLASPQGQIGFASRLASMETLTRDIVAQRAARERVRTVSTRASQPGTGS